MANHLPAIVSNKLYAAMLESLETLPDADRQIQALLMTMKICDALHDDKRVYIPHGNAIRNALNLRARDAGIRADFRGNNHEELARKYNLTDRQIRRILKR